MTKIYKNEQETLVIRNIHHYFIGGERRSPNVFKHRLPPPQDISTPALTTVRIEDILTYCLTVPFLKCVPYFDAGY